MPKVVGSLRYRKLCSISIVVMVMVVVLLTLSTERTAADVLGLV